MPVNPENPSAQEAVRHWLAVACASHVARGAAGGFMQVCHGKAVPLRRMQSGDGVVYYSPSTEMGGKDKLQSLTALGTLLQPYLFDMSGGFVPWRRDVCWQASTPVPIAPLLEQMEWSRGQRHWGYRLRFGVLALSAADFAVITQAFAQRTALYGV